MVFDLKTKENLEVDKYKARLVADEKWADSDVDGYANALSFVALRLFFDLAAKLGHKVFGADFVTAFLNSYLPKDKPLVFMRQCKGFQKLDSRVGVLFCAD